MTFLLLGIFFFFIAQTHWNHITSKRITLQFDHLMVVSELLVKLTEKHRDLQSARDSLFDAIKHGDDEHQAWLKNAIDKHFDGEK